MNFCRSLVAVALTASILAGCSGAEDAIATESADAAATAPEISEAESSDAAVEPATTDWAGINDPAVRAAIDARLEKFFEENGEPFGLLVVETLDEDDPFGAAGQAAFSMGMPTIVIATEQRDIQFVGDEALAYFEDDRARMAKETAEFFDRGEFEQGIDHALVEIQRLWQDG